MHQNYVFSCISLNNHVNGDSFFSSLSCIVWKGCYIWKRKWKLLSYFFIIHNCLFYFQKQKCSIWIFEQLYFFKKVLGNLVNIAFFGQNLIYFTEVSKNEHEFLNLFCFGAMSLQNFTPIPSFYNHEPPTTTIVSLLRKNKISRGR